MHNRLAGYRLYVTSCLISLLCLTGVTAQAQGGEFLRFVDGDEEWHGTLQTAIVSYENGHGVELDLVAAIHIGEPDYYGRLNDYFRTREAVLYELVADSADRPVPGQQIPASPLSFLQRALAGFLDVRFQLELIDYSAGNFHHADMSPAELQAIMAAKDESFISMFLQLAMAQMVSEQNDRAAGRGQAPALSAMSLMSALSAENRAQALKYLIAQEMGRAGGMLLSPDLEQELTILGDRNRVALEVLEQTLSEGSAETVSLFYGAAHMPGLERHILNELGFVRVETAWIDAWSVP